MQKNEPIFKNCGMALRPFIESIRKYHSNESKKPPAPSETVSKADSRRLKRKLKLNRHMPNFGAMKLARVLRWSFAGVLAAVLFGGLALFAGCKKDAPPDPAPSAAIDVWKPTEANPKLPTVKLYLGPEQMDAEMCVTPRETETGMMFRKSMGENDGMIFSLGYDEQASFWMNNCFIPLSVAYIDSAGVIQEIHPLQPQDTNLVFSATNNIRFALETPQGWFDKHHIATGMVVRTERGSLMQTFGQH